MYSEIDSKSAPNMQLNLTNIKPHNESNDLQ